MRKMTAKKSNSEFPCESVPIASDANSPEQHETAAGANTPASEAGAVSSESQTNPQENEDESKYKYIVTCKTCGKVFRAKGANASYCTDCMKVRKVELDKKAWERRKRRAGPLTITEHRRIEVAKIEAEIASELQIDPLYLPVWREWYPALYKRIVNERLPESLRMPSYSRKNNQKGGGGDNPQ